MASDPTTRDLSDRHEAYLAELFGGRRSRGSGNQTGSPLDVRMDPNHRFAFGFEGKSTRGKSLSVPLSMIDKLNEQAHGLRPALALRWYRPDNLLVPLHDLVAVRADDLAELIEAVL